MKRPLARAARAAVASLGTVLALVPARTAAAAADPFATWLGLPAWLWMAANLIIFFGFLGYYVGPPLSRYLESRGRRIEQSLAEARERRAEAADMQTTLAARIAELEAQIAELAVRADREGQREHETILAQAAHEKERMVAQAEGEIEHRVAQAREELKDFTAELAARLARERLERELGPAERDRLFRRNLRQLEREPS